MKINKKLVLLSGIVLPLLALTACGGSLSDEESIWNQRRVVEETPDAGGSTAAQSAGSFVPGVFEATSDVRGYGGHMTVRVTVDEDGQISDIEVLEHFESDGFYQRAFDGAIPLMLSEQTPNLDWDNVDAISGATYSTKSLASAVGLALQEVEGSGQASPAGGGTSFVPGVFEAVSTVRGYGGHMTVSVTVDESGNIVDIEVLEHSESEGFYQRAFDGAIPLIIAEQNPNLDWDTVDAISGATYSTKSLASAVDAALEEVEGSGGASPVSGGSFTPGVFEATSDVRGYNGHVTVRVTINENGQISDIEVLEHSESEGFYQRAFDGAIPLILSEQTPSLDWDNVDAISGATYSTKSLASAVEIALQEAE